MLKARVFPNYENMIRNIWFCIVLTANTCSLHENQHYHVLSSMVYVKQVMTSTLLLALVAIIFTPNNIKTISIFILILHKWHDANIWEWLGDLHPILKDIWVYFFHSGV